MRIRILHNQVTSQTLDFKLLEASMTLNELGSELNKMYSNSNDGEAVAMIHLFGIKFAKEIIESRESMKSIAMAANIRDSYATEISKGVKLSKFVGLKTKLNI